MLERLQINEILYKSSQGKSEPYICKADDGQSYYVKGQKPAGRRSQTCELLAWFLGQGFGLPLPPAAMLEVSEELHEELTKDLKGIGKGMLFGLQECPSVRWFEAADVYRTTEKFRRDLLVFDYWISNDDRTPGNSNLLYSDTNNKVIVIDHNLAFNEHVSRQSLIENHIFSEEWPKICADLVSRAQYAERIEQAFLRWDAARGFLPEYWKYENDEYDILVDFDIEHAHTRLGCFRSQEFWEAI